MMRSTSYKRHVRRVLAAAVPFTLLAAAMVGCGDDSGEPGPPGSAAGIEFLASGKAQAAPDPAAASSAADLINAAGADLYSRLGATDGNLALSPYSIVVALAMARAGAEGQTGTEIDSVVHASEASDLHAALGSLDGELATREGTFPVPDADPVELELRFANAVWPQNGFPFEDEYLDLLATRYGAGVYTVDYAQDAAGARDAINGWVSDQTRERIPELIPEGVVDALTRLVLTNALYLKAPWLHPFQEGGTSPGPFTQLDGTTVNVPLMGLDAGLDYATGDGWQAVRLPYIGGELAMVVAVPDAGGFDDVDSAFDTQFFTEVESSMEASQVRLRLPRWEFRSQLPLNSTLQDLGMTTAFTPEADFSGLSSERLSITDVIHEVFIAVDEEGTEAAAATAVVIGETSAPGNVVELTVDRPFHFWIVDQPTGTILFLGRVLEPETS